MYIRLPRQAGPRPTIRYIGANDSRATARALTANHSRAADVARMIDYYRSRAFEARMLGHNHSWAVARTGRG